MRGRDILRLWKMREKMEVNDIGNMLVLVLTDKNHRNQECKTHEVVSSKEKMQGWEKT